MEKFNEADVMREIKSCTYEQDYETAVKLAEQLDLNKMKNVSSLCLLGEIFLHEGENDLAEKVLLKAYDKMPKGRRALDMLTSLYIDKGSYTEAEYYYKEFISVASRDLHRYILRYRLDKGKGERTSVLIHTLEQLKDYEYIEEWAYELARLYAEAGDVNKCLRECDEIALWFGHGEYVDKANTLKEEINAKAAAAADAAAMQQTVGATYMFDSEGLLERSDFNVPLNVEEYMQDDDEYSDVYDLEEGGRTETIELSQAIEEVSEEVAEVPEVLEETLEEPMEEVSEERVEDAEIIAAKTASILSEIAMEEDAMEEDSEEEFIARMQKNVEMNSNVMYPEESVDIEQRLQMAELDADDEEDADDEIISSKLDHTAMNLFFSEMDLMDTPETKAVLEDIDDSNINDANEGDVANTEDLVEVPEEAAGENENSANAEEDDDEIVTDDIPVPDTVLDIFSTAVDILDVKKQLAQTFSKLESSLLDKEDILAPYDINFVVSGTDESMQSQIAIGIAKALNTYGVCDKTKIVRATAEELNGMDFSLVFEKISGGCLIISAAGALSEKSVDIISEYVNKHEQKVAIVLEDSESDLMNLWKKYPKLRSKFLNVIHISKYDVSELVKLAESYAKRRGYDVSEEVHKETLKTIFTKRMSTGADVNYEDVMAVVDEAVVNLEKRNMKNLFMTVLDNAYEEARMFTLLKEDFIL